MTDAATMTADAYRRLRRGTGMRQADVARELGIHVATLSNRERGLAQITNEAAMAMLWLASEIDEKENDR